MKIIGQTEDGWVVTMTKDELANFNGMTNSYYADKENWKVGTNVPVSKIYAQANEAVGLMASLKNGIESLNNNTIAMLKKIEIKERNASEKEKK